MYITRILTEHVIDNKPISFSKYGDGEYDCVFYRNGKNCDYDSYTDRLGGALLDSFKYMVDHADNAYIGLWHDHNVKKDWERHVAKDVPWAGYHSIIIDGTNDLEKVDLYRSIKYSPRRKIIVCNRLLTKSRLLFDADELVIVPLNNWFDHDFEAILEKVSGLIGTDNNHIVMTCCGMSAKVLICELYKRFPGGIYLDFGSAIDLICTKRDSRGREYDYNYIHNLLKELLPQNWDDESFEGIYREARHSLGVHLPK